MLVDICSGIEVTYFEKPDFYQFDCHLDISLDDFSSIGLYRSSWIVFEISASTESGEVLRRSLTSTGWVLAAGVWGMAKQSIRTVFMVLDNTKIMGPS